MKTKFVNVCTLALVLCIGFASCSSKASDRESTSEPLAAEANNSPVTTAALGKMDETGLNTIADETSRMTLKTGLDNNFYLKDQTGRKAYLYVEAKAGTYSPEGKKRSPLNICLVIDHSGSMEGDKLMYAKKAAKYVVDKLNEGDYLSIVKYDTEVEVVQTAQKVTNKQGIKNKIDQIQDAGGTNLGGGLVEGYKQVKSSFKKDFVNRVLLMSDGLANEGITSPEALQKIAKEYCQEYSISLSTFGIGLDFNENLMTGLAEYGCGNYYFIDDPEHIPAIFEKELNGLLNLVAQDVKLTMTLPAGVKLDKLFGYKYEQQGSQITVNFRDVFSDETKSVLLRLDIADGTSTGQTIKSVLNYTNAMTAAKDNKMLTADNILEPTNDKDVMTKALCEKVKEQVILFESNDIMEQAMEEADKGNYEKARDLTESNTQYLDQNAGYVTKSEELQTQQSNNVKYKEQLKNAESMTEQETKVMQKSGKSANYMIRKKKSE